MKIDTSLVSFSQCVDRFVPLGYKEKYELEYQIELASRVEGLDAIAFDYPTQIKKPIKLKKILENVGLGVGMIEIDLYSKSKWMYGSLSSSDKKVREEAVKLAKEGMDICAELKGADVQLWLGQDGFDYPFQSDYEESWEYLIENIKEIAEYRSDVKVTIEYKMKEPRTHCYIDTVGKALLITNTIGLPNLGVTLDFGHSLIALENPANSAVLLNKFGRLFHLHLNDNYRDWDHDLILGSVHFWETLEFFYWLNKIGYDGWFGIDIYPYREDGILALTESIKRIRLFKEIASKLDRIGLKQLQTGLNSIEILEMLREELFTRKGG